MAVALSVIVGEGHPRERARGEVRLRLSLARLLLGARDLPPADPRSSCVTVAVRVTSLRRRVSPAVPLSACEEGDPAEVGKALLKVLQLAQAATEHVVPTESAIAIAGLGQLLCEHIAKGVPMSDGEKGRRRRARPRRLGLDA